MPNSVNGTIVKGAPKDAVDTTEGVIALGLCSKKCKGTVKVVEESVKHENESCLLSETIKCTC